MKAAKSILLIEDDTDDQWFFMEALQEIEDTTLFGVAGNGKEALDRLTHAAILPAVIFTDVNMPLMSGIELLAAIAQEPRLNHIPVVMLSTDIAKKELAYQLGAKAFIKKTGDSKSLREQMEQIINSDSMADSMADKTFVTAPDRNNRLQRKIFDE